MPDAGPLIEQVRLHDGDVVRELVAAVIFLVAYLLTAPRLRPPRPWFL